MNRLTNIILLVGTTLVLSLAVGFSAFGYGSSPREAALSTARSFYRFHLAHNKDFTARNVQQRKRWLTPELYKLLIEELKREAEESKSNPDEAPYFEGDPFTASQEYPDSFRVGKVDLEGELTKVTVTLLWSARTSRGRDKRDIVVEMKSAGGRWLIADIINNDGTRLLDDLKR
ncbi:MAG: DUF3828 domain-containing protein [Blastocatellia bacterium]